MLPYLILADLQNTIFSALFTFSERVIYPFYATVPRLGGVTPLDDQVAAGAIMWVPGSIAFLVPAALIMTGFLGPRLPTEPAWQQDRTGAPMLDGLVKLRLTSPSGDADRVFEATATHDAATNKLLYAAWIDVGAGHWDVRVVVQHGGETARGDVPLTIVPATMPLADYWPHLLLPPIAIVVFVLYQCLVESRRSLARPSPGC